MAAVARERLLCGLQPLVVHEVRQLAAEHLVRCVAEHLSHPRVDVARALLGIHTPNAIGRLLEKLAVAGLAGG